ncbi:hypothetical protein G5S35_17740 [Paraburkholderia tropica]|uniref:hypothetical protein n=1 Tax=Paraburkholderia tropica TaxID=92647 RepID=UPI001603B382|nr:hypothetical protein [Paraburkholderia tropica]QNB13467.1 hypothetical protein G5S35_17740 [Paraburkholderia tropica]
MSDNVIFIIESGKALDLVKHHIAEKQRVARANRDLLKELGVEDAWISRDDGTVLRVRFKSSIHPQFTKADKNGSRPKKGTDWAKRFEAQKGYANQSSVIADAFDVPLSISYGKPGNATGWRCIGLPLCECGFLYFGENGPYALWVPDVEAEAESDRAKGYEVAEPAASFRLEFDGCRRISREEWEFMVAKHNLEKARAA